MVIHEGDRAVCLSLPESQPCLVSILAILDDGMVLVSNGRMDQSVYADSCILQDLAVAM